jgi:hypothetical protein
VRCDAQRPMCGNCAKLRRKCQGYRIQLSWPRESDGKRSVVLRDINVRWRRQREGDLGSVSSPNSLSSLSTPAIKPSSRHPPRWHIPPPNCNERRCWNNALRLSWETSGPSLHQSKYQATGVTWSRISIASRACFKTPKADGGSPAVSDPAEPALRIKKSRELVMTLAIPVAALSNLAGCEMSETMMWMFSRCATSSLADR